MSQMVPPYPTIGECIRALAGALDVKHSDRHVDRLAREGDFDWAKIDEVIQKLLVDGMARVIGEDAQTLVKPWLLDVKERYCRLVLVVPLDALDRSHALPVLIEHFFVPNAGMLLMSLHQRRSGPDLRLLLNEKRMPVAVLLDWLSDRLGSPVDPFLYPTSTGADRTARDKLSKWRTGIDVPSSQSIQLLVTQLRKRSDDDLAASAGLWLLVAAALARFERSWMQSLRPLLSRQLISPSTACDPSERLAELVRKVGAMWPELAERGQRLWSELKRAAPKVAGDQSRLWSEIEQLQALASVHDPEGRTAYHYAWMKARWHVLSGQYEEAFPHFENAFEQACYRAGHQLRDVVQEAACIAAFLGKTPALKRLKHVAVALGLFRQPEGHVVEDWEVEQFRQQLPLLFPPDGRFPECRQDFAMQPLAGLLLISDEAVSAIEPDLKRVDRVRAVHFEGGRVKRWPQISLFVAFGQPEQVRRLLNAGASVDALDSSGGSPLLCALQHALRTGERMTVDLLLKVPHHPDTLNSATARKKLTPLMCAIELGEPDVVAALLAQGADPNMRAQTDQQSPLYYAMGQLSGKVHPDRMMARLVAGFRNAPDLMLQDTLRRYGVGSAGLFGSQNRFAAGNPAVAVQVAKFIVEQHVRRHRVDRLQRIIELLLTSGANPNAGHSYPVPGRTPLMLAAESDLPEAFDLMVRHGGEPMQPDAAGQNCMRIALAFGSGRVVRYIKTACT
ncbi:ankyrin repeat domain-containing protein [Ralstonia flatus]|uniref:Ankyrin n=1 Tax=Ralstonia flatus TaxID=3058601 RepID=A0ABN9KG02_9RALS|nr:ankyrin repeat domain-containing protein [Ralstonia sp. LMG 32965]MBN6209418.1 ankyrin repeat domain-containing protein [Ralstonia pickettii]CAJ0893703.1 hypothetical protein R77564_03734 [Ralstonia sp. LMG 32965]